MEYYDLDETYKDFVKILLTVHKRVYDMKHKMDIWFFQEEKNMKNISTKNTKVSAWKISQGGGVNVRGVFVLGGNCPGGIYPGVIVRGVIVRGVIVLIPFATPN